MIKHSIYIIIIMSLLFSCKTDDDGGGDTDTTGKVLIVNEGNFGFGNASLSLYNAETNQVDQKIFQLNNSGRPIGDVVQSAIEIEGRIFVVVNNSSKIEVIDRSSFKYVNSIEGLNSPRYILPITTAKAYVSDLYEDKIYVINPSDYAITKTIDSKGWVEEMLLYNNKAFLCHMDSNQVWVVDVATDQVIEKINTHVQPQHIEIDKENNLWVSCSGGFNGDTTAIYKINSSTFQVEKILTPTDNNNSIGEIEINDTGDELYYLSNGDLFKINIIDDVLARIPAISGTNRLFYGLSVHQATGTIYLCDAIDYLQRGVVTSYDKMGNELNTFKAGIIPGDVVFLK